MERRTQPGHEYHSCDFMDDGVYIDMNCLREYEDTGLTPEQIMELKERDTEKSVCHYHEEEKFRAYCPTCKRYIGIDFKEGYRGTKNTFCPGCGQRVKWED